MAKDKNDLSNALTEIKNSLKNMRTGLELLSNSVDPNEFYFGFRKKLRSFEGIVFEGQNIEPLSLSGASAVQSPAIKFIDSALGITHNSAFLDSVEKYMKKPHQEVLKLIRNRNFSSIKTAILEFQLEDY